MTRHRPGTALGSGKKDAIAWLLSRAGLASAAVRAGSGTSRLRILAYHRVLDLGPEDEYPYDPELVSASVADFSWQMEWLRDRMRPIALSQVARAFEAREP